MSIGNLHMLLGTQLKAVSGEIEFTSPDGFSGVSQSWIVPPDVFFISVACISGGGGGASTTIGGNFSPSPRPGGAGGGGGGLSFDNYLPVTPGETITVILGSGGAGGTVRSFTPLGSGSSGDPGGPSRVIRSGSWEVTAGGTIGGRGGAGAFWNGSKYAAGLGGAGGTGDGVGGRGGSTAQANAGGFGRFLAAGGAGGGPGGWGGAGGRGYGISQTSASGEILEATLGELGGGAGGGNSNSNIYAAYGNFTSWPYLGTAGPILTNNLVPNAPGAGGGGAYSAGGLSGAGRQGKAGRVRIMWDGPSGPKRSFPYGLSPVITSASSVDEGSSITFSVTTSNVPNGTVLYWNTSRPEDFTTNSGSFVVNSNSGSFSVTPTLDGVTEGPETFTVNVWWGSVSGKLLAISDEVTINDVE